MRKSAIKVGALLCRQSHSSPPIKVEVVGFDEQGDVDVEARTPDGSLPHEFKKEWLRRDVVRTAVRAGADEAEARAAAEKRIVDGTANFQAAQLSPWDATHERQEAAALDLAKRKAALHALALTLPGVSVEDLYALDGGNPEDVGTYAAAYEGAVTGGSDIAWEIRLPLALLEALARVGVPAG